MAKQKIETEVSPEVRREQRKKKQKRWLIVALALVTVAVTFVILLDNGVFDGIRRKITYGSMDTDDSGVATIMTYEADNSNQYALLGNHLLIVSSSHITIIDENGNEVYRESHTMESPALSTTTNLACIYDLGGTQVKVFHQDGLKTSLLDLQGVLSASVNESGFVAVVDSRSGYKGVVTVYSDKGSKVFDYCSSSRFINKACVSKDNRYCAIVTMGQEEGTYISNVLVYSCNKAEKEGEYVINNGLVLGMSEIQSGFISVTDQGIAKGNTRGSLTHEETFSPTYLRAFDFSSQMTAVLLGKHQSGSAACLQTFDNNGTLLNQLDMSEEITSFSVAGRYLAVLMGNRLTIYTKDLKVYSILYETASARRVIMKDDGSCMLIGSSQAWLYIPQ